MFDSFRWFAAFLPILTFLSLFLFFWLGQRGWRESWLLASLVIAVLATVFTEILSVLHALSFEWMFALWSFSFVAAVALVFKRKGREEKTNPLPALRSLRLNHPGHRAIGGITLIVAYLAVVCWFASNHTADALIYHMPRVMHWIQNKSVANYPTSIFRQLMLAPGSSYGVLQFQILTGTDYFANFIQWFSMIGSVLGASLIAKYFQLDRFGQLFAAILCATIPMGILQATNTANHYVLALWITCFVFFVLKFLDHPSWQTSVWTGLSAGLAVLTKETAYIFLAPFLLWWTFEAIRKRSLNRLILLAAPAVMILLLNAGVYTRHLDLYGHMIVPQNQNQYNNEVFSISAILSNVLRNAALHLSTSATSWNQVFSNAIVFVHGSILHIGVSDSRTTWSRFSMKPLYFADDVAGNFVHLILILFALALFVVKRKDRRIKRFNAYLLCIVAACLLFCIYVKWMPWHSRLHLPVFVLFTSFVAVVFVSSFSRNTISLISMLLFVSSIPWLLLNVNKPVLGTSNIFSTDRQDQRFYGQRLYCIVAACDYVNTLDCNNIGLDIFQQEAEYLYWDRLKMKKGKALRIQHVNVLNGSEKYSAQFPFQGFQPCVVITRRQPDSSAVVLYQGSRKRFTIF